jgi:hypothetical protein
VESLTEGEEEVVGTLRALDLDKDFLDVVVNGQGMHIVGLGDAMDDVIGPMVNKTVRVQIVRRTKENRFRDIELDEQVAGNGRHGPQNGRPAQPALQVKSRGVYSTLPRQSRIRADHTGNRKPRMPKLTGHDEPTHLVL